MSAFIPTPSKICMICQAEFKRRADEHRDQYLKRSTCSRPCSYALKERTRRQHYPDREFTPKPCTICGGVIERHERESFWAFSHRHVCSTECGIELIRHKAKVRAVTAPRDERGYYLPSNKIEVDWSTMADHRGSLAKPLSPHPFVHWVLRASGPRLDDYRRAWPEFWRLAGGR